ncbi:DUF222 domain-containing protein [Microbacterium sp. EF45047]|nr:DUF222 domain-containing protein [Microbacterium sp. EF45047]
MNKELLEVSADKAAALERLVCSVGEIEGVLTRLQAMRDGFLAVGAQLAVEIAAEAEHPDGGDMSIRSLTAELGALLRVSDRTVQRRMSDASALVALFPSVWEAQGEGRINAGHARVIADAVGADGGERSGGVRRAGVGGRGARVAEPAAEDRSPPGRAVPAAVDRGAASGAAGAAGCVGQGRCGRVRRTGDVRPGGARARHVRPAHPHGADRQGGERPRRPRPRPRRWGGSGAGAARLR